MEESATTEATRSREESSATVEADSTMDSSNATTLITQTPTFDNEGSPNFIIHFQYKITELLRFKDYF